MFISHLCSIYHGFHVALLSLLKEGVWRSRLYWNMSFMWLGFPGCSGKELACQCRTCRFDPWVLKIPWRSKWPPTPAFLPGNFHGQRSLMGYRPWGCKSQTWLRMHTYICTSMWPRAGEEIIKPQLLMLLLQCGTYHLQILHHHWWCHKMGK